MGTKYVDLTADDFDFSGYAAGKESVVGTVQVPTTQVWQVDVGAPLVCALVTKQTVTVTGGATETKQLSPEAPVVDYMDDPTAGQYTEESFIAAYFDDSGDGNKDTLVTDSTGTQYTGTFGSDGDFVDSIEFNETDNNGDVDVDIYTVVRYGYTKFRKRNSGKSNVTQELQTEDSLTWAFSNPDDPNSDRQVTWDGANSNLRGVLPPKFNFDLVFYDETNGLDVDEANASNIVLSIPLRQRPLKPNENAADLRRRVSQAMV